MTTEALDTLIAELRRDEGEVLHAYKDTEGYVTVGVGRLLDKRRGGGISREESAYLLRNDISKKIAALDQELPWWRQLSPTRQRVIVNMAFNLGVAGLLGFKNTLASVQRGDYDDAALRMLDSKWATQVGDRAKRLADLMRTG